MGAAIRRRAFLGLLAGAVPSLALAQPRPKLHLLVQAGRLLDVRTGRAHPNLALLVIGDRIAEVGPAATLLAHAPAGTPVLDLGAFTVLPGLIDAHTHLTYGLNIAGYEALGISVPREALIGAKNARLTLLSGFTTVRNLGARGYADIALRDAVNEGEVLGPRILASGPAIGSTGGHMDCSLLAPEFNYRAEGVADGRDAVIRKTREVIKYGADVVKVAVTGGILSKGTIPSAGQYSDEELRAIVEEAHRLGRKVAAHAHGADGLRQAVRAGVDSIEHGSLIDEEGIRLMKAHRTYLVPTLYAGDWFLKNALSPQVPQDMIDKAREMLPLARAHVSRALRAGVKVALGTDSSVYPHGENSNELSALVDCGLTPLAALQAATIRAAELLGWGDRVGELRPGFFADLIAVPGDPLAQIQRLSDVPVVMKGGVLVKGHG
jgi:imidazolonepropionase-like amidohydrolase